MIQQVVEIPIAKVSLRHIFQTMNTLTIPRELGFVIIAGLVLRIAVLFATPMGEFAKYEQLVIAEHIVSGNGFYMAWPYMPSDPEKLALLTSDVPLYSSAFMPPFVPVAQSAVFAVFGVSTVGVYAMLVIQCLVGALIPWLVYRIALRLTTSRQALFASVCSVLFVPGLLSSATPSGAVWYSVAGLLVVDIAQRLNDSSRNKYLLGLVLGLLALMRSEFLAIGLVIASIPLFQRRWRQAITVAAVMLAVVSPWLARNAIAFGKPIGIISHPWREIWRGANERAIGSGYGADKEEIWEGKLFPQITKRLDSIPIDNEFELRADAVFKDEAMTYIKNNPAHWAGLGLKKMAMLWTIDPYYPRGLHPAYIAPTLITSALILCGLAFALAQGRPILHLAIILSCLTALFGVTYVLPRYQVYVLTIGMPLISCIPLPQLTVLQRRRVKQ